MDHSTVTVAACSFFAASILAVVLLYVPLIRRIQRADEKAAQTRVELMALVRAIEFRASNVHDLQGAELGHRQLRILAADLRTTFPDYFPPEVGGEYQLTEEHRARGW